MKGNILPHILFFSFSTLACSAAVVFMGRCVSPELRQKEKGCFPDPEKIGIGFKLWPLQRQVHLQSFKGRRGREQQFHIVCKILSLKYYFLRKRVDCGRHRNGDLKNKCMRCYKGVIFCIHLCSHIHAQQPSYPTI